MRTREHPDLTGRTIVVTGANAGIGFETALALAGMGAGVVLCARNRDKGEAAVAEVRARSGSERVELGELDLASFASIRRFADWFLGTHERLDVLVNNAGLITSTRQETAEGFEQMFGVNHLGHFLLTDLLTGRLVASAPARVVVVTSFAHRWAVQGLRHVDLHSTHHFHGLRTYGRSKLANALFALELARRLEGTGVTVNAVHPGSVNSHFAADGDTGLMGRLMGFVGPHFLLTPEQGARTPVLLASSARPEVAGATGAYFSHGRRWRPSRRARDEAEARWLWEVSERLVASVS